MSTRVAAIQELLLSCVIRGGIVDGWDGNMPFIVQKMCEIHGGTLVQIETAEEDEFIAQQMRIHSIRNTWLGGSDWAVEGSWVWEPDGKILQYSNFAPGKPNNFFGENCLDKEQSLYYQWNDEDCDTDAYYICEKQNVIGNLIG
ncbi:perlucin-like [Saccostrea cucullata]|uniref:perlucin-like n=1 Tax=Saccostrea cuccullata TaxID=36930 RepID=UPI002ED4832A